MVAFDSDDVHLTKNWQKDVVKVFEQFLTSLTRLNMNTKIHIGRSNLSVNRIDVETWVRRYQMREIPNE